MAVTLLTSWNGQSAGSIYTGSDEIQLIARGFAVQGNLPARTTTQANLNNDDLWAFSRGVQNQGDKVAAPVTNATYVAGGAGSLTGSYIYLRAYRTATGITAPWVGQPTPVALTAQRMTVTGDAAPTGVIGTLIYRSVAGGSAADRAVFFLTEIPGNAAFSYDDNAADGTLGDPPSWTSSNRGLFLDGLSTVPTARFADQATTFGQQAGGLTPSYATTAIGFRAGASLFGATRNTFVGVYAGELTTTGRENTYIGVHSGNATITGTGNTCLGYQSGGTLRPMGDFNTCVGHGAMGGTGATTTPTGTYNLAVGYRALQSVATALSRVVGVGPFAGAYADAASQLYLDNQDRGNTATAKTDGLVYAVGSATMQSQTIALNAAVRAGGRVTVAQLPAASAALASFRFNVTDGSVAYASANVGATVVGGGANVVPVYCNGTNWVIG